jgi:hypothetical protein
MTSIVLIFDNAKTVEKKKSSKITYALKTEDDDPIKVRLTLEAESNEVLEKLVKKILDSPVELVLKNIEKQ